MKLISLNVWGGKEFRPLIDFIKENADSTDIFCFQEVLKFGTISPDSSKYFFFWDVTPDIFDQIQKALPAHAGFFFPIQDGICKDETFVTYGQGMFISKKIEFEANGFDFFYRGLNMARNDKDSTGIGRGFQYARIRKKGERILIGSAHGPAEPGDKLDTKDRLHYVARIKDFLQKETGKKILCGDFNLLPDTESIKILESDFINLIKEFRIKDTRGPISQKKFKGTPQYFADYTFVSKNLNVKSFKVPEVSVSDHLPMILEFEV